MRPVGATSFADGAPVLVGRSFLSHRYIISLTHFVPIGTAYYAGSRPILGRLASEYLTAKIARLKRALAERDHESRRNRAPFHRVVVLVREARPPGSPAPRTSRPLAPRQALAGALFNRRFRPEKKNLWQPTNPVTAMSAGARSSKPRSWARSVGRNETIRPENSCRRRKRRRSTRA